MVIEEASVSMSPPSSGKNYTDLQYKKFIAEFI
jgi:hypothetical protein